jgi:hypothetical protein
MKVFLSWSGSVSKQVALILREWLPRVIQAVEPWMSSEDIEKGNRWGADLANELTNTKAGIVCVTADNREAPWLNFEAGALSKTVDSTMVCTYLYRLKTSDIKGPLVQFQATEATKEDTWKLLTTLNKALQPKPLSEIVLSDTFAVLWPKLESKLNAITLNGADDTVARGTQDMLEELLDTARDQARMMNRLSASVNALLAAIPVSAPESIYGTSNIARLYAPSGSNLISYSVPKGKPLLDLLDSYKTGYGGSPDGDEVSNDENRNDFSPPEDFPKINR